MSKEKEYPHHNLDGTVDIPHLRNAIISLALWKFTNEHKWITITPKNFIERALMKLGFKDSIKEEIVPLSTKNKIYYHATMAHLLKHLIAEE